MRGTRAKLIRKLVAEEYVPLAKLTSIIRRSFKNIYRNAKRQWARRP